MDDKLSELDAGYLQECLDKMNETGAILAQSREMTKQAELAHNETLVAYEGLAKYLTRKHDLKKGDKIEKGVIIRNADRPDN